MNRFEAEMELHILLNKRSTDYEQLCDLYNKIGAELSRDCQQGLCTYKFATNKLRRLESRITINQLINESIKYHGIRS
jgi:hypothetical protein